MSKEKKMLSFNEEEFAKMCDYDHRIDDVEYGLKAGICLGFPPEKKVSVAPGAILNCPLDGIGYAVRIGIYTYINGKVTIGDHVLIGPHCSIAAGNHKFDPETGWFSARTNNDFDNSIEIGFGSWLASNVTVTAGVKIGRANLICAGAVVTKSTEDYAIMAGIPARKVGHIDPVSGEYIWKKN